jgi:flavin-dependent dehydrogenase
LNQEFNLTDVERVTDEVDVCIVGAGPAGLSAAIRLMKKAQEEEKEIRVVVLEKGAEVGEFLEPSLAPLGVSDCAADSGFRDRRMQERTFYRER